MRNLTPAERETFVKKILDNMPPTMEENYHIDCDQVLIDVLEIYGETEIVEAYKKAESKFWYS